MDIRPSRIRSVWFVALILTLSCAQTRTNPPPETPTARGSTPTGALSASADSSGTISCSEEVTGPVPSEYQATYASLEARLTEKLDTLAALPESSGSEPYFGAELIPANGNRGDALLQPNALPAVNLYLDRLQTIGVTGVSIQVSDPLLTSPELDNFSYLEFFRQVVEEAHRRGLKVMAETGPAFPDPQYSKLQIDWSGLTAEEYFSDRKRQLTLIALEIRPDFLSLGNEPETEQLLTGLEFTPEDYRRFLNSAVAEIGGLEGLQLGGGTGSWEDPAYRDAFLQTEGLDFLDTHIYPIAGPATDFLDVVLQSAHLAAAAGRKVVVGESWLYKALPEELVYGASYASLYARDVFSFWQPLDILFIRMMVRMARAKGFAYLSFFWSGYFFAYLDYEQTPAGLSPVELIRTLNQAQYKNLAAGEFTAVGCAYRQEIRSAEG
ncbi:MAG: hypothetical protein JW929_14490 [Anaerolineales bacterium]|nr:hypothetical protein [Anaerolineales bacterium]